MITDIMVDIETLGTQPGSAILAIAAVTKCSSFVKYLSNEDSIRQRFTMDVDTINWWLLQPPELYALITSGTAPVKGTLEAFSDWLSGFTNYRIWGNGAGFDIVLLEAAYRKVGVKIPWNYWQVMCYRTLKNLYPDLCTIKPAIPHDPYSDAAAEYQNLQVMLNEMRKPKML